MLESDGPGGAEMVMLRLAGGLRERGHEVVPVGPATGCGWLAEQFRQRAFEPETFLLRRPLDWQCLRGMTAMLRRRGVDVLHSHEFTMAVYGTAAARLLGRAHVITMHGNQTTTTRWRRRMLLRMAFHMSQATIGVSADTKRHLDDQLRLDPRTVQVVPNGVPVPSGDGARVRRELGMSSDELLVLATGSLVPRKGHAVLMQALAALRSDQRWQLAIAGGGPERARLETLRDELGVGARVHLLGHRNDVGDLLDAADVFAMPSLWEGLPLALLEAMAAGKPVVASATSGIPEAITPDVDGVLAPPGDVSALSTALQQLLSDGALRARLGAAAASRAARQFSIDTMTSAYERVYLDAVSGTPHGAPRARP
jgi:glycosyltransferase involved in cell wall biosynthesis